MSSSKRAGASVPLRESLGMACEQCGRADQPDAFNRCKGCGARHYRSVPLDVTSFADREPMCIWVWEL